VLCGGSCPYFSRSAPALYTTQQEIGFFDENRTGDILSRLADDCGVLQSTVTTNVSMLLRNMVTALGTLIIIFIISWRLTLVMIAVVPVLAISAVRYGKFVKAISKSVQVTRACVTCCATSGVCVGPVQRDPATLRRISSQSVTQ
jgi:ABC-type multidrug transport system fused ATPase/permease subunit